jgi:hypothetical protein
MKRLFATLPLLALVPLLAACPDDGLGAVLPDIHVEDRLLDFGTLPVLHVRSLETETANRGRAPLTVHQVEVVGEDAAYFTTEGLPDRIEIGAEHALAIRFRPEAERTYAATLRIHSDDPEEALVEIDLVGEGHTTSAIEVDPESIHFGLVGEGTIALEQLRIQSVGTAALVVDSVTFEDGTPVAYEPVGSWTTPATIEPGEEIALTLSFRPEVGQIETACALLIESTDPWRRVVRVPLNAEINRAPIADCGTTETVLGAPGDVVTLDGTGSHDPDGHDPITFHWDVVRRPLTSLTELAAADTATPTLELDVAGTWEVDLIVADALGVPSAAACRVQIRAVPAERLYVELVWDHAVTDLDLHVLAPGGELFGDLDCWWGNPAAYGCEHSGDDLAGFGPEWVRLPDPDPGIYRVVVRFAKDNGAHQPATGATLRVYQYGVLEAEMRRILDVEGTTWNVMTIEWPSGQVNPVDTVQVAE